MNYVGAVLIGIGFLILLLNGVGSRIESPEASRRAEIIALIAIGCGIVVQCLIWWQR